MDLSTFIIAVFCSVGEFLGLDTDEAVFTYFGRHYAHFFPALREVHRTTFARKAANLWKAKERLWQEFVALAPYEYEFSICDSMPLPACPSLPLLSLSGRGGFRQGRASQVNLPRLRIHARVSWPGVITRFSVAPANAHEISVVPEIVERTSGLLIGDRNYLSPKRREELYRMGIELLAPFSSKKKDPAPRKSPKRSALLSRFRYRIDTVFAQLVERYSIKRVWARDMWHLVSRLHRKVLSHIVAFLTNHRIGNQPLQLSKLLVR